MKAFSLLLLIFSLHAQGDVYKCIDPAGDIVYQAIPCKPSNDASVFTPEKIQTQYKSVPIVHIFKKNENKSESNQQDKACPFMPSYELRNLRVKDKYRIGMKKQDIRQRLGQPASMKKNKWTYLGNHVNRTFQFKNGCLTAWKEKWKGKESQISKYRN